VVQRRLDPKQRYGLRVTLFAIALVLVAVPFSTLTFLVLGKGPVTRLDGSVANRLNAAVHGRPAVVRTRDAISWLGKPLLLGVLVSAAAVFVWWRGRHRLAMFLVVTVVGGGLVDSAVKILVNRPRPVVDHPIASAFGKSFPSGHSMSATVTYGALLLVFLPVLLGRRRVVAIVATVALVLAIGCSRLLLGVHFVSDVVGGYLLGLAWLSASVAAFQIWRTEEGRRRTQPLAEGVEPEAGPALQASPGTGTAPNVTSPP
jgi:undecaprenyl-diphosphatase